MQTILKNRKTKKQARNKLSQRGGSGRASRNNGWSSRASHTSALNMPSGFYRLKEEVKQIQFADAFPPVPKHIPGFTISVSIAEVSELKKIFTVSPTLDKLIDSYKLMHLNLKDLAPKDIRKDLLDANIVLGRMIELLKEKYIYSRSVSVEQAMQADKWCDYINKLIVANQKNIGEINEFLA